MPEYIERSKAIKELNNAYEYEYPTASGAFDEFATTIVPNVLRNIPAADVAVVVHGEWIEKQIPLNWCEDDVDIVYECSICGCENFGESPYCPDCGAKMDGERIKE